MVDSKNDSSKLDVYARPFVSDTFHLVNNQPAICVDSYPVTEPFLDSYFLRFPGIVYLPIYDLSPALPPTNPKEIIAVPLPLDLDVQNYYSYFRQALNDEEAALSRECADQALFNARLLQQGTQHDLYRLHVPGLREQSIRVEVGDTVQLRQLRLDPRTGLPLIHTNGLMPMLQYNAVVYSVIRVHEMLMLRIDNLIPETMIFNVVFVPQEKRLRALRRAILFARDSLRPSLNSDNHRFDADDTAGASYGEEHTSHSGLNSDSRSFFEEWPALPTASNAFKETVITPMSSLPSSECVLRENDSWIRRMLFPLPSDGELQTTLNVGTFGMNVFDDRLNYEQLKAVSSISNANYGDVPYLISGPPGTGKTKSIVEVSLQLVKGSTQAQHILVCAPSDSAADTLALRLSAQLQPEELLRLNGTSRTFSEVPEKLLIYSYTEGPENLFSLPPFPKLMRYKIVVTTCQDADVFIRARVTNRDLHAIESGIFCDLHPSASVDKRFRLHWDALLIDEAAQATEPQSLIPISVVAPPNDESTIAKRPLLIMAGDQRQLGPRTASKTIAIDTSLFERLFDRALYKDHPLARSRHRDASEVLTAAMLPITRPPFAVLKRNYRSHPAILAVPSALFYNDTLVAEAADTGSLLAWDGWRGRKWPVMFSANSGTDEIETDGGGWFNLAEARLACQYAKSLVKSGLVAEEDVCIMSPFRAQVRVLRGMVKVDPFRLFKVNVGTPSACLVEKGRADGGTDRSSRSIPRSRKPRRYSMHYEDQGSFHRSGSRKGAGCHT